MNTPTHDRMMTPREVANLLSISVNTLREWNRKGRGPKPTKVGNGPNGSVRYTREAVAKFIEERTGIA